MKKMFLNIVDRFEEIVGIILLAIMLIIMVIQIFSRYVLDMPLTWSEEAARYLFIWITFIGAGYGVKHQCHISMEALFNLFPKSMQRVTCIFVNLICVVFFIDLIPYGFRFMISQHMIESVAMKIPMSYITAALPMGCTLIVIRIIIDTIKTLTIQETITKEQVFIK
ncbi:MAG: TRAP transporter small permease [Clostridia bacterium]